MLPVGYHFKAPLGISRYFQKENARTNYSCLASSDHLHLLLLGTRFTRFTHFTRFTTYCLQRQEQEKNDPSVRCLGPAAITFYPDLCLFLPTLRFYFRFLFTSSINLDCCPRFLFLLVTGWIVNGTTSPYQKENFLFSHSRSTIYASIISTYHLALCAGR